MGAGDATTKGVGTVTSLAWAVSVEKVVVVWCGVVVTPALLVVLYDHSAYSVGFRDCHSSDPDLTEHSCGMRAG